MLRPRRFSRRAWLLSAFVAAAIVLGGGGSANPASEVILQLLFAAVVVAWIWSRPGKDDPEAGSVDRAVLLLLPIPLILPLIQLVPLPPSIWTALPGRADAIAALQLVGQADSWRPISLSPSRTLASLLATIPPLFCVYAAATLPLAERRLQLAVIAFLAVLAALFGAVQLVSPGGGLNLYDSFSLGWITGFQANRNAAADVFVIGLLAVAALAASGTSRSPPPSGAGTDRRASQFVMAGIGLLLLAATVMTGSRAGILLAVVALCAGGAMFVLRENARAGVRMGASLAIGVAAIIALVAAAWFYSLNFSAVGRVLARFSGFEGERWHVWEDTLYAIAQYWPVGSGMGTFGPIALAVERLEVVNQTYPNRAHNDYLEIGLEAGIAGYAAIAAMTLIATTLALRAWRSGSDRREQIIFSVGVLVILAVHSLVDYPIRSMALACLAGVAAGMLAKPPRHRAAPLPAGM